MMSCWFAARVCSVAFTIASIGISFLVGVDRVTLPRATDIRIDGTVKGNVIADDAGTVVLSEHASVEGEIRVAHAVINGKVLGPIYGAETVELQSKADVCGDVHYRSLEVQIGAIVQGRLAHAGEQRGADKVVALKSGAAD